MSASIRYRSERSATSLHYQKVFDELNLKCAVSREQLVERFHARRRNASESIARFAEALCTLLSAAMPGIDADIRYSLLKTQLCSGVPDNVKALVNFNRPLSLIYTKDGVSF